MVLQREHHHSLYHELSAIVGSNYVSDEDFALWAYSKDASLVPGTIPGIIVRPGSTDEVSQIVRLANRNRVSVIPRGGGASIHGFPTGEPGRSIVIDITRMDKVIDIDEENMLVSAECGITLSELATKVRRKGFDILTAFVPHHMDTLGGILSGQEGGGQPQYFASMGTNWRYVLGFKVVLPDGTILQTGSGPGTSVNRKKTYDRTWGAPDVTGLFMGDGGIFGVKTEATLMMFPLHRDERSGSFVFNTWDDTWRAISKLMEFKPLPYDIAMGIGPYFLGFLLGREVKHWSFVYLTRFGYEEILDAKVKTLRRVCEEAGGKPGSKEEDDVAKNLGGLHQEYGPWIARGGVPNWIECLVPKSETLELFRDLISFVDRRYEEKRLGRYGVLKTEFMLPIMHHSSFISMSLHPNENYSEAGKGVFEIDQEFLEWITKRGVFSENAQGHDADFMASYWSPAFRDFVRTLKKTIDPNNIINPGLWRL